jgi:hypothetical protein
MVTRTLLAVILCLMPAFAAAQTDTGPRRDIAAIHHLVCCDRGVTMKVRFGGKAVPT